MRGKLLFLSAICGLFVAEQTLAADDVYVDLSVLDAVPQDSIGFVPAQPLFPEVKNTAKPAKAKKVVKAKKAAKQPAAKKKTVAKKNKTDAPKVEVKAKTEAKVAVPSPVEPVKAEPLTEAPKTVPVEENTAPQTKPEVKAEAPKVAETPLTEATEKTAEPQNPTVVTEEKIVAQIADKVQESDKSAEVTPLPTTGGKTAEQPQQSAVAESLVISANSDNMPEQNAAPALKEVYAVTFPSDSSELTSDSQQTLEEAAQKFDKNRRKKIAIKAYNFDNGEDSFRKKRVSLTRATEVRSYFLTRGFKNFSIKVVNSSADDEYKDTVEVEELD